MKQDKSVEILGKSHNKKLSNSSVLVTLSICAVLTLIFVIVEFIGGILTNSVLLISDAVHMSSDTASMIFAIIAILISRRKNTIQKTYGYTRIETLASFVNGMTLVFASCLILYQAAERLINPQETEGLAIIPIAILGLIINFIVMIVCIISEKKNNPNKSHTSNNSKNKSNLIMQGILLHVLSDIYGQIAAIISGIVIYYTSWTYIDPLLSIVIVVLILKSTWHIIKNSSNILLESTPLGLSPDKIKKQLETTIDSLLNVHHIHLWMLNEEETLITLHCVIKEGANVNTIIDNIKNYLVLNYNISHSTIQVEIHGRKTY